MASADTGKERRRAQGLFPSRDVDVDTALELFEWSHYRFARSTESLPPDTIRTVLAALVRTRKDDPAVVFLQSAVDEADLANTWKSAVGALKIFGSQYGWGSKPKRDKLGAIAREPRLLAATQASASTGRPVPDEYLAVLALDGSEESVDALLPHFDRAMKDPSKLDAFERLRKFAKKTPAITALLDQVDARLARRVSTSPVLDLARRLGIVAKEQFKVRIQLRGEPPVQLDLTLDTGDPRHFVVWLHSQRKYTTFDVTGLGQDSLGLGPCSLDELPGWLVGVEKKLKTKWRRHEVLASNLRGQRLTTFLAWLFGA